MLGHPSRGAPSRCVRIPDFAYADIAVHAADVLFHVPGRSRTGKRHCRSVTGRKTVCYHYLPFQLGRSLLVHPLGDGEYFVDMSTLGKLGGI